MPRIWKTLLLALELHVLAALLAFGPRVSALVPSRVDDRTIAIDLAPDELAPRPPVLGGGRGGVAPRPAKVAPVVHASPKPVGPAEPPPPAARAGEALTTDHPSAETIVRSSEDGYAGGTTQQDATGGPTYDPSARAWGVVGAHGTGGGLGSGPDLSRPARLGGNKRWSCQAPAELSGGFRTLFVRVQADVMPDGSAARVIPMDDDAPALLRAALPCALAERYVPALDREGKPTRGLTVPFRVVLSD